MSSFSLLVLMVRKVKKFCDGDVFAEPHDVSPKLCVNAINSVSLFANKGQGVAKVCA